MSADLNRGAMKRRGKRQNLQLSEFRKLLRFEKVAAVCFRICDGGIEFLLVRSGSGHWTFPKGSVEPGLTHAQAAALEAYEEAGVHGRMEEGPFTTYTLGKRSRARLGAKSLPINAHLCEVLRLSRPQESGRNRTWFSAGEAKRRLREDRAPSDGAEMAGVVDRAVRRVQRLRRTTKPAAYQLPQLTAKNDALQKVQFETREAIGVPGQMQAVARYVHASVDGMQHSAAIALAVSARIYDALRLAPPWESSQNQFPPVNAQRSFAETQSADYAADLGPVMGRLPQLSNGLAADAQQKVTQIDSARSTPTKPRARQRNTKR